VIARYKARQEPSVSDEGRIPDVKEITQFPAPNTRWAFLVIGAAALGLGRNLDEIADLAMGFSRQPESMWALAVLMLLAGRTR